MSPDVPYYLPWRIAKHIPPITHTFRGTFTLCLPIGMALLGFCWLLRNVLVAPLWASARAKCLRAIERFGEQPVNWVLAPLSILIGAWSHIAWDSFTHADGWMVRRVSALSAPVTIGSYTGQLCHVLQYASSVFGLAVLAVWFLRMPTPEHPGQEGLHPAGSAFLMAVLVAIATGVGTYDTLRHLQPHDTARYHLLYLLLTRTVAWFALLHTVTGTGLLLTRRSRVAPEPG